jgi:hypothetical protein
MKTEKLSFKGIKNELSRAELKEITAGSGYCVSTCSCAGMTGTWIYTDCLNNRQVLYDIGAYCRYGAICV